MFFDVIGISPYRFFLLLSILVYCLGSMSLSLNYSLRYREKDYYALPRLSQATLCLLFLVLIGFYGARLGHFLLGPKYYAENPLSFFSLRPQGLVSWGSFLGFLFLPFLVKRFKLSTLRTLDMFFFFAPLQIAVRRFGCLFAGCCAGPITDNAFICLFSHGSECRHPFPLYIIIFCAFVQTFLFLWARRKHQPGTILTCFFLLYCSTRFVAEFFRDEALQAWGMNKAQLVCIVLLPIFFFMHLRLRKSPVRRKLI